MTEPIDGSKEAMNLREDPSFPHEDSSFLTGDPSYPLKDSSLLEAVEGVSKCTFWLHP